MVGPFVFFDQFGPTVFRAGRGLDVRPHPHIGLATVTYLLLQPGTRFSIPAEYDEQAIYVVRGTLDLGRDGLFEAGRLLVLKRGAHVTLACAGSTPARVMLLGGEPMDGPRHVVWNFVSSSRDRIE
jgi:redox-sensitive bicupin YhaK (pirin superfamily)